MSNLVPGSLFPGFGAGALHLQSQRKCQVRLNRARISVPNESGESGEGWVGSETLKWSKGGPALTILPAFSCASALAINFAYSFEQLFKGDCKPEYLRPSRTLERGNKRSRLKRTYFN